MNTRNKARSEPCSGGKALYSSTSRNSSWVLGESDGFNLYTIPPFFVSKTEEGRFVKYQNEVGALFWAFGCAT